MFLSVSNAITAATDYAGAARAREQTGSDGQTDARNYRKPMNSAGIEPRRRSRWSALAKTGFNEHNTPRRNRDDYRREAAAIVAARQREEFGNSKFDIGAAAVVFVLIRGDGQRPRTVMPASRLAVVRLRGSVLVTPAEA